MRIVSKKDVISTSSSVILGLNPGISSNVENLDETPPSSSKFAFPPQLRGIKGELNDEPQHSEYIIKIPIHAKKTDLQDLKTFLQSLEN
jgi:hypothetical protein